MEMHEKELTQRIIAALIEVHSHLGAGLLESSYEECLSHELMVRKMAFERQVPIKLVYKGVVIDCAYRADMIVEGRVLLELKSVDQLAPIHEAQLISYLKISGIRVGLLVNFNVQRLVDGIIRRVV